MCGIAGYSCWNEYDSRINVALPILALAMENRGRRSWGWTDGDEQIIKDTGSISEGFNPTFFGYKQAALHTRQPTTGDVTKDNSHPFRIGSVLGMHNGVVRNHEELQKKYGRTCKVDSEHIFHHINENLPLSDISAYGAIVFWRDNTLYLGRFNGGDLCLVRTKNAWLFASTKEALKTAIQLSGLNSDGYVYYKLKEDRLYRIEKDVLYKDSVLDFGHYSVIQHGTWNDTRFNSNGGIVTGFQTQTRSGQPPTSSTVVTDRRLPSAYQGEIPNNLVSTDNRPLTPHLVRPSENPQEYMSLTDKVTQLVNQALTNSDTHHEEHKNGTDDGWKCDICEQVTIKNGEEYIMCDNAELVCMDCAESFREFMIGGVLRTLPEDIFLVQSFDFGDAKGKIECDDCDEVLEPTDYVVFTKEHKYLCPQCFAETGEKIEDDEEETSMQQAKKIFDMIGDEDEITETEYSVTQKERLDNLMEAQEAPDPTSAEEVITMMDAITDTIQ